MRSCISRTARTSRSTSSSAGDGSGVASRRVTATAPRTTDDGVGGIVAFCGGRGGVCAAEGALGGEKRGGGGGANAVGATVSVPASGHLAGAASGAGGGSGGSVARPPCDRRAADFVIRREPQPGQVTMASGLDNGAIGVLQRGQFIFGRGASIS